MQATSRPSTTIGRTRTPASVPKVDLQSLLSTLRPELLRNPLLAPPQRAALVPRRPSCLKQRSIRPPSAYISRSNPLAFSSFTSRAKAYTLLTATYCQPMTQKQCSISREEEQIPWPTEEAGDAVLASENSSVMIDKQQLAAVFASAPSTTKSALKTRPSQLELCDKDIEANSASTRNLPIRPAIFRRHRVIHSAHPSKPPLGRSNSQCDGLMLSPKAQPQRTRMAVVTHVYPEQEQEACEPLTLTSQRPVPTCKRAKRLKKTKTMATFGTQTQEDAGRKGKIDIYFPDDLRLRGSPM